MEEDDIIEGTPPDIIISQRFFAKTAPESVIGKINSSYFSRNKFYFLAYGILCFYLFIPDITDEMCPPHHIIPGHTAELETIPPAKTPPRKR